MNLEISYAALKKMVTVVPLAPVWNKVYWRVNEADNSMDLWCAISGGFTCHAALTDQSADMTDFDGHKVSGNEVTSDGTDDGRALAARTPLSLL